VIDKHDRIIRTWSRHENGQKTTRGWKNILSHDLRWVNTAILLKVTYVSFISYCKSVVELGKPDELTIPSLNNAFVKHLGCVRQLAMDVSSSHTSTTWTYLSQSVDPRWEKWHSETYLANPIITGNVVAKVHLSRTFDIAHALPALDGFFADRVDEFAFDINADDDTGLYVLNLSFTEVSWLEGTVHELKG
jgi:hypothetical protein